MRLLIVVLTLMLLVIVDQFKFGGYYTSQFSQFIGRMVRSVT
jgi:hypothetical protein